jgi:hypothetical protein
MKAEVTKTFASPSPPLPPKVIPLFATAVPLRLSQHTPSFLQDLPQKPRYHPYKRPSPRGGAPGVSPLQSPSPPMEVADHDSSKDNSDDGLEDRQPKVMLIDQPPGFSLAGSGWKPALIRSLRVSASHIDLRRSLTFF